MIPQQETSMPLAWEPPTIFGHGPPGTTDPTQVMQYDLQGGDLVTQSTVLE